MPEAAGELCEDTTLLIDPVTGLNDSVLFGMGIFYQHGPARSERQRNVQ